MKPQTLILLVLATLNCSSGTEAARHEAHHSPFAINAAIAGCTEESFVEVSAAQAEIGFGTNRGYSENRCLKVKAGTTVTIAASGFHPLDAMADMNGVKNPFSAENGALIHPTTRTLTQPGIYGYYCRMHSDAMGSGMAGVIWVTE